MKWIKLVWGKKPHPLPPPDQTGTSSPKREGKKFIALLSGIQLSENLAVWKIPLWGIRGLLSPVSPCPNALSFPPSGQWWPYGP